MSFYILIQKLPLESVGHVGFFFFYLQLVFLSFFSLLLFSHQVVTNSLVTPWTVAHKAFLSMGFSRQEYWSGLPFPSPGDLPNQGLKLCLLNLQAGSSPLNHQRSPLSFLTFHYLI